MRRAAGTGRPRRPPGLSVGTPATEFPARAPHRQAVPAFETALALGSARVQNTVMLGAVSWCLEFPADAFHGAITTLVKPQVVELNLKAFAAGRKLGKCAQAGPE